ncbi:MAG: dUTP diphosphatase [Gammaproteobacteria bacterium]|nr:MAG: dUTP diphosphatase [Pseudomonadota bacterium]PIE38407.1 MAG: dUTP diphosphatase [Gammaproteobacteria bacterium]
MKRQIEMKVVNPLLEQYGLPDYQTPGSAALDLVACIDAEKTIPAGENALIGSGIAVNIQDPGLVAVVASRSGLCLRHQVRVGQGMGVVDSDYHGEIGVILQNDSSDAYIVRPGDRIAQLLFMPVVQVALKQVDEFTTRTERGAGGFGSTGK